MKSSFLSVIAILSLIQFTARPVVAAQNTQAVEQAVKAVAAELRRTWNAHDADAYMALFDTQPSGLFISTGKAYSHQELRARVQEVWSGRTTDTWTNDRVQVIVLSDTSALLQITMSGRYTRTNGQEWEFKSSMFGTFLVQKRGNAWKIVAEQNSGSGTQVKK
ncbi:MAG: SgcJ/EcaC family oxidoreductase [Opitutaceae bacterium]|nr:SgcJ/EcaC family oxidoreductase [Opitutaceae bacterium]